MWKRETSSPRWDTPRFNQLVANGDHVVLTFLNGTRETDKKLNVVEIVP
jgi:hypothetical protein